MTPNDTERARMPGARNSDTAFNSHTTQVRGDQYPGSSAPTSHNSRADEGHLGRNDDDPGNGSDNARRASASTADSARSTSATSSTGSDVDSLLDFYLSEPTGTPPLSSVAPPEASEAALPSPYAQGPQLERGDSAAAQTWRPVHGSTVGAAIRASVERAQEWYRNSDSPRKVDGAITGFAYGFQGIGNAAGNKYLVAGGIGLNALTVAHNMVKIENRTYLQWGAASVAAGGYFGYAYGSSINNELVKSIGQLAVSAASAALPHLGERQREPRLPNTVQEADQGREPLPLQPLEPAAPTPPHIHPAYGQGDLGPYAGPGQRNEPAHVSNSRAAAANAYLPQRPQHAHLPSSPPHAYLPPTSGSSQPSQGSPRHRPTAYTTPQRGRSTSPTR
ncbi:hypothetical protein OHB04_37410 [Streptomyces sp. NBC_01775]|uniref:hypothetical protein n=1 Tax=Streptomyces sp. NBC_01775 TaxID=2975939 RepID=UPI002DD7EE48|nr:hypothetical protein [Streptomyces sp. NBC_01775]WSB80831.1 hypothetical protein OHB04_37410 [Streptomyces sp. NBC_01775]